MYDQNPVTVSEAAGETLSGSPPPILGLLRRLVPNETLFQEGDAKTCLYRVRAGSICLYERRWDGKHAHINFAFAGDLVGLGFLETYACCARAVTPTELECLPLEALGSLVQSSPKAQADLDQGIEREFEYRRAFLSDPDQRAPIVRVAAFLLSLSHNNTLEGRDPSMIGEAFQCGLVAGLLGLRIPTLARTLVELERRGLVETCHPAGLRLKDLGGLHRISDRPPMPKDTSQATTSKLGYAAFGGM
ncbi:MAG TPA: Crp/Fnr family transcriptional regulator [Methyloceanibacter sp.]|jgi:CRP/FNR family transcriptional regulator